MRKRRTAAAVLCAVLVLCGCVKKYTRGEVRAYARKATGRPGIEAAEGYREIQEDEEGYLDHLWELTDKDSGITFHVLDDYYWSMEKVRNRLLNDFDACAYLSLLEGGELPTPDTLSIRQTKESGLVKVQLLCSFRNLEELGACHEALLEQRRVLEEKGFADLMIPWIARYENPLSGAVDYEEGEGDTEGTLGTVTEETLARMRGRFLSCALDYRFEDALSEFGKEEIEAMVQDPQSVRIYRLSSSSSEKGGGAGAETTSSENRDSSGAASSGKAERKYYEGVIASPYFAGISFGTLYEILKQEGMDPEGSAWHYSFKAADGSSCEISYDFNDLNGYNDSGGKLRKGYYYIRDGKKIRMESYYQNHFDASRVSVMTGLSVGEERPHQR